MKTFGRGCAARCAVAALPHRKWAPGSFRGYARDSGRSPRFHHLLAEGQSPSAHQAAEPQTGFAPLGSGWGQVGFSKPLVAVLIVVALLASCGLFSRRVKLAEEFTMKPKEKVVVAGAGLEIELEGVGHQTFPNPQPRPLRSSYVTLRVNPGPARSIEVSDSVDVGEYTITVKSADPFASGGRPSCQLVVTRR